MSRLGPVVGRSSTPGVEERPKHGTKSSTEEVGEGDRPVCWSIHGRG